MPFFSLYLDIRGLQKCPGKLFMGSWKVLDYFVSKRVGTLCSGEEDSKGDEREKEGDGREGSIPHFFYKLTTAYQTLDVFAFGPRWRHRPPLLANRNVFRKPNMVFWRVHTFMQTPLINSASLELFDEYNLS